MFHLPSNRLNHDLTTVPARLTAVKFRVAADMGTDGAGRDAHGQRNFGTALTMQEHLVDGLDILFLHG